MLQSLCEQTENRPLAGLVVIGNGQAARAVSLAGTSMQLPVLWAKGGVANLHGTSGEVSIFWIQVFIAYEWRWLRHAPSCMPRTSYTHLFSSKSDVIEGQIILLEFYSDFVKLGIV